MTLNQWIALSGVAVSFLALALGLLKVYISSRQKLAIFESETRLEIESIRCAIERNKKEFDNHVMDNNKTFEQYHKENREDHKEIFNELRKISDKIK